MNVWQKNSFQFQVKTTWFEASPVVLALSVSGEVEGAGHDADVHQVVHDPGLDVALVLMHHHLGALALLSSSSFIALSHHHPPHLGATVEDLHEAVFRLQALIKLLILLLKALIRNVKGSKYQKL